MQVGNVRRERSSQEHEKHEWRLQDVSTCRHNEFVIRLVVAYLHGGSWTGSCWFLWYKCSACRSTLFHGSFVVACPLLWYLAGLRGRSNLRLKLPNASRTHFTLVAALCGGKSAHNRPKLRMRCSPLVLVRCFADSTSMGLKPDCFFAAKRFCVDLS